MDTAIVFDQVVKSYGGQRVLDGLSLRLAAGKVTALLGPNGAGKTTAVSLLLQLKKPTEGKVQVMGLPAGHKELRQRIGVMLQETAAPDGLTVRETLQLFRSYYRKSLPLERLLQISGLEKEAAKRASALSGGQKRRLAFATALAGDPEIIVLDEPTVGMDVEARGRFWDVVKALAAGGRTILLTTHYLEEADAVADRIVVINRGRLVCEGTPQALKSAMPNRRISFTVRDVPDTKQLYTLPGVEQVHIRGTRIELQTAQSDEALRALLLTGWEVTDVQVEAASLESVFRQLTEDDAMKEQGRG